MEVRGRDLVSRLPKTFTFTSIEIREALKDTISTIVDGIRQTLQKTPPGIIIPILWIWGLRLLVVVHY